ncbi:MAG: hypothetical protein WBV82_28965 [Myxococcaceae bacterium]
MEARVDGAAWRPLRKLGGTTWEGIFSVPTESLVQFRALGTREGSSVSGLFRWPDAAPVDPHNVSVVIRADRGPSGGAPVQIDQRMYSLSIADWESQDYDPAPAPAYVQLLRALRPGVLRWPAGHNSQEYLWERLPEGTASHVLTASHVDAFLSLCRSVEAEPMLAINLKTSTAAAAADLVRYINVDKSFGMTWVLLGNEPDLGDALIPTPEAYVARAREFIQAIRAVDPDIRFVGPELMSGATVLGIHEQPDWLTPILQGVGPDLAGVSWHLYPLDSNNTQLESVAFPRVDNLLQERAVDWRPSALSFIDEVFPAMASVMGQHAPAAKVWVTEWSEDSGELNGAGIADRVGGALWAADALGRMAAHGPGGAVKWLYKSGSTHAYALVDENDFPRPEFTTHWLYARHFGTRVVQALSDKRAIVNAHAALREDGALAIVLVNKRSEPQWVNLELEGFTPGAARRFLATGEGYETATLSLNGTRLEPGNADGPGMLQPEWFAVEALQRFELPPFSILMLLLEPV